MTPISKKQLNNRNRLARQFLLSELRLYRQYLDRPDEYRKRVIESVLQLKEYAANCSPSHALFLQLLIDGKSQDAICKTVAIQPSTYYSWRNKMIDVFAQHMDILI